MPVSRIPGAKGWGEMRGRNGLFQGKPAVQLATDVLNPDAATELTANWTNSDGPIQPVKATFNTDGKRFIRAGWIVALSSGSTLASAWLEGTVAYEL